MQPARSARNRSAAVAFFSGAALLAPAWPGHATCGSASCFLVTDTREGVNARGQFKLDLSFRFLDQDRKRSGSHETDEVLTPKVNFEEGTLEPDHHREILSRNTQLQLDLGYGITGRLTLVGVLPLVNHKYHQHFDDVGTGDEHFTDQDGSTGFGDAQVGARYAALVRPRDLVIAGFNLKLPTGEYRGKDGEGAINEPSLQPGTGSTDFIGSLHYSRTLIAARLDGFVAASYRKNTSNPLDYRLGTEAIVNWGIGSQTGSRLTWVAELNLRHTSRDEFLGGDVPSTGATYLNLTPGVRFRSPGGLALYGFVQVPAYQRVNEAQLVPGLGVALGVAKSF